MSAPVVVLLSPWALESMLATWVPEKAKKRNMVVPTNSPMKATKSRDQRVRISGCVGNGDGEAENSRVGFVVAWWSPRPFGRTGSIGGLRAGGVCLRRSREDLRFFALEFIHIVHGRRRTSSVEGGRRGGPRPPAPG